MSTQIKETFTDEVIKQFKTELTKIEKGRTKRGMFTKRVVNAYLDVLDCIEKESIKDIDDLDEYVDEHYSAVESERMIIAFIVQFAEDDFEGGVTEIFAQGKRFDIDSFMEDDEDEHDGVFSDFGDDFEGKY